MYELIRFMYKHIWQVQKGESKNELGTLLIFTFNDFVLWKGLNLLHSAKCSVSTQLTYIPKIQYNKVQSVQQGKLQYKGVLRSRLFLHLKLATLPILWFLQFLNLQTFGYLATLVTTFGTTLQIFTKPTQVCETLVFA